MTISPSDLHWLASQRMTDADDGGGLATAVVLPDGVYGASYAAPSAVDLVWGLLQLRKLYFAVSSQTTDALRGAYVYLSRPPAGPDSAAWLMRSGGISETRAVLGQGDVNPYRRFGMWVHAVAGHTWAAVGSTDVWVTTAAVVVPGQVWSLPDPISRQATSGAMVLAAVQLTESERQAAGITLQADHYAWRITWDSPVTYGYMVLLSGARGMTGNGAYVGVYGTWPLPAAGLAAGATEVVLPMHTRLRVVPRAPGSAVIMGATDVVRAPQVRWSYETLAAGIVAGDLLVLHHQAETAPAVLAQGQTVNLGRTALAGVRVIGADGQVINTGYTADLAGGTLSVSSVVGWSQPVRIQHRIEEVLACAELSAERPDRVRFIRATQRTFPPGAYLSSAISLGDLQARASASWEQEAWTSTWSDARIGNGPAAQYDQLAHPVEVVNRHAVTERWRLDWTSSTTVRVIGEQLGVLGSYSILADVAPLNPATGGPYFTVRAAGFGTGWQAGNQLRINTFGAIAPFWAGLVLLPAAGTGTADSIELCGRGDVPIE